MKTSTSTLFLALALLIPFQMNAFIVQNNSGTDLQISGIFTNPEKNAIRPGSLKNAKRPLQQGELIMVENDDLKKDLNPAKAPVARNVVVQVSDQEMWTIVGLELSGANVGRRKAAAAKELKDQFSLLGYSYAELAPNMILEIRPDLSIAQICAPRQDGIDFTEELSVTSPEKALQTARVKALEEHIAKLETEISHYNNGKSALQIAYNN